MFQNRNIDFQNVFFETICQFNLQKSVSWKLFLSKEAQEFFGNDQTFLDVLFQQYLISFVISICDIYY